MIFIGVSNRKKMKIELKATKNRDFFLFGRPFKHNLDPISARKDVWFYNDNNRLRFRMFRILRPPVKSNMAYIITRKIAKNEK